MLRIKDMDMPNGISIIDIKPYVAELDKIQ